MTEDPKFHSMSIEEARELKWALGAKKYGPKFVGHPLEQFDSEMLDALNYIEEAERWGYDMDDLATEIRSICERVRRKYHHVKVDRCCEKSSPTPDNDAGT